MLKLALRNLLRHGVRTGLTLGAIALGVASLILAGGFVNDVYVQLAEATIHSHLGHLQIYRQGYYAEGARKPFQYTLPQQREIAQLVEANPAVQETMMRLGFSGLLNNGRADLAIEAEGVEPEKEARLGSFMRILKGRQLQPGDTFGILVGEGVAKALRLEPGSHATLLANTSHGALNSVEFQVVGIFRSFSKDYDNRVVRVPIAAAQELLDNEFANALVVVLHETPATNEAKAAIARVLADHDVEIKSWQELSDFYEKTIQLYQRQFGVLQLITLIMVVLSVTSSVSMSTFERVGELGTMRALGDRSVDVFRLIVLENFLTGIAGGGLGVLVGASLAVIISAIGIPMPPPPNAEGGYTGSIQIIWSTIGTAFCIGLIATVLAAIWPARRIAAMPLAKALQQNI